MMSSRKDIALMNISPLYDQFGFSLTRHFLFSTAYLLRATNRLSASKDSLATIISLTFCILVFYIENFFAHEVTAEIKNMFAIKNCTLSKQNDSLIFNKYKTTKIAKSLLNQKLVELLCLLTGYSQQTILTEIYNNTFLQTVILSEKSNTRDPQQKFHLDTFFTQPLNSGIFPFDVTLESAPFEYVPEAIYRHLMS